MLLIVISLGLSACGLYYMFTPLIETEEERAQFIAGLITGMKSREVTEKCTIEANKANDVIDGKYYRSPTYRKCQAEGGFPLSEDGLIRLNRCYAADPYLPKGQTCRRSNGGHFVHDAVANCQYRVDKGGMPTDEDYGKNPKYLKCMEKEGYPLYPYENRKVKSVDDFILP